MLNLPEILACVLQAKGSKFEIRPGSTIFAFGSWSYNHKRAALGRPEPAFLEPFWSPFWPVLKPEPRGFPAFGHCLVMAPQFRIKRRSETDQLILANMME